MPFETINEHTVRQQRVRVCGRCRKPLPDTVKHRGAWYTGSSIGGSLGGSMLGARALGGVLGPVGAIGGMIGGAIAGSRAGVKASEAVCDGVEYMQDGWCDACKAEDSRRRTASANWGGGRLGDGSSTRGEVTRTSSGGYGQPGEQTFGNRIGEAASRTGENISAAASIAGERLSVAGSWMKSSVSSAFGGSDQTASASNSSAGNRTGFQAFQGQGRTLGSGDGSSTVAAPPLRGVASQNPPQEVASNGAPPVATQDSAQAANQTCA